jgi:hypothetical protein
MSRDHSKLRVFQDAHRLTLDIYQHTRDYVRFLHISLGSACELKYLIALTLQLGYENGASWEGLLKQCDAVVRQLERLVQRMEQMAQTQDRRPKTVDRRQ